MIHVILNPCAGGGRAGKLKRRIFQGIKEKFEHNCSFFVTRGPDDATISTQQAIKAGVQMIIVVGGDGTIQEAVNGFFENDRPLNYSCQLGIVNCGTGKGLALSIGLPYLLEQQLDSIFISPTSTIDLGRIIFFNQTGERKERIFVNDCQVGIGSSVVAKVGTKYKRLGGKVAFGSVAFAQALRYKALPMQVEFDKNEKIDRELLGIVVGNGAYTAGGMKLTPAAKLNDGQFDVLLIHNMNILNRLWNFPKIYQGTHIRDRYFSLLHCRSIYINSKVLTSVAADGELLGTTPCSIEILPRALKVRCNLI